MLKAEIAHDETSSWHDGKLASMGALASMGERDVAAPGSKRSACGCGAINPRSAKGGTSSVTPL
jgi:hypothetical protein